MGNELALENVKKTEEDLLKAKVKAKKRTKKMSLPVIKKKAKISKKIINKRQFLDISDDEEEEMPPELIENEASHNEKEENTEANGTESASDNDEERDDAALTDSDNVEEEEEEKDEAPNDAPKSYKKKEIKDEAPNDKKKEISTKPKSNIVHDEPETIDKIERINLTRKKQAQIFDPNVWTFADEVKTGDINVNKWIETHSARDIYFSGDDEVRGKMTKKLCFLTPIIHVIFTL